jgi:PAX-interacting protein 1
MQSADLRRLRMHFDVGTDGFFPFQVLDFLKNGKASFSKFMMDNVTHCVVGKNYDESQVQEARELYEKPTVTEGWVLASVKLGKLVPVRPYDPITSGKLFHGCIFTMHSIDAPDRLKLYAMITLHGGTVQKELDNKVTHLLLGGSQSIAIKVASLTKNKLTIITPDWVQECLKQKKIVEPDAYHPNLLITANPPQASKITLMPQQEKSPMVRSQLQQNVRPPRPIIQTMQHTPQQINEIIQSQIQQQQMQEKAKQQRAAAGQSPSTTLTNVSTEPVTQKLVAQQPQMPQNVPQPAINVQQTLTNQVQVNPPPNTVAPNNQMTMQRQISLQQIEANQRNQKIQMISQQLQQSTNQQMMAQQRQQMMAQNNQMINQPQINQQQQHQVQQQVQPQVNQQQQQFAAVNQQGNIQGGQVHQQHFPGQQMKQIITPNQPQNQQQQFIMNQNAQKTVGPQNQGNNSGSNYIQIIQQGQQGQQIIQIHPEGGQMQQKVLNHPNQQQNVQQMHGMVGGAQGNVQQIQGNVQQIQGNVQQIQGNLQQIQGNVQQIQQVQQGQGNRQNIVIINQVQNPQGMNPMGVQNQRFQGIQNQNQVKGPQQIIHQKIIAAGNEGIVQTQLQGNPGTQQNPQIIQVHQSTISGPQQNVVDNIMIDQKMQAAPNVVHVQQNPTQALTQAQAVQQIAQQLQSGTENIASQMNPQMQQGQVPQQMNIITQSPVNPGNQSPQVPQSPQSQWIPQSPTQQTPQSPVVQHIITTNQAGAPPNQGQFIRATGQRLGHIYLDAQSSIQFQKMDPAQRQEYLEQLHNKQQAQAQQRGVMFQQRANAPARPQHHIVIRSQMPQGLNSQQQMQWIQNQRRQIVIRPPNAQQQIPQQANQNVNIAQFQIDPNATPQQQQMLRQQQAQNFQRLQQIQQNQKMSGPPTPNSPRGPGFPEEQNMPLDPNGVSSSKTKTALANMLSSRLGNNGNVTQVIEQPGVEQSAAGTLRMMTAQHNAALNVQGMPPGVVRNQQELIVLQQQQQIQPQTIVQSHPQLQQRRSLGNITNPQVVVPNSPVIVTNQIPAGAQVMMPQSPKVQPPFSPGRAPPIANRAQFYGHNPNLKLPADLFLLGCHFLIVEYDETNKEDLNDWHQSIKHHGGEIETCYNVRVTHVLSRTQKHGIVMQAIRDNKRCVTVYWLNDIILKKQVLPPWQAIHLPSSSVFGSMRPGMKHVVTIMGFEGDERERIKRMIEESGAKLTTYMNRQNTVMVCKRLDQTHKKFLYAKEFNIPMVNVVWLSDLLIGNTCQLSQFDSPKYQQYNLQQPLRIDHSIVPQLMSKLRGEEAFLEDSHEFLLNLPTDAWKAPINLTQEAHERVKRSQMEPTPQKAKKLRTIPFLETFPEEISCVRQPEPNNVPVVMFSQVDNVEGLNRAVT